eukprot:scaffold3045_cov271-Chaetoceros_neogracile.AAC.9
MLAATSRPWGGGGTVRDGVGYESLFIITRLQKIEIVGKRISNSLTKRMRGGNESNDCDQMNAAGPAYNFIKTWWVETA